MLPCSLRETNLYPSLVLALRDMRTANGRDPATGEGGGNDSWIGLTMGMIVLDSLTGRGDVGKRWTRLLTVRGVSPEDATIIYELRCSLLHGYGIPRAEAVFGRRVVLTADRDAYAVDTATPDLALVSVPVFCGGLVERIAAEVPNDWDVSRIDTNYTVVRPE